jgi:hypothetical protein
VEEAEKYHNTTHDTHTINISIDWLIDFWMDSDMLKVLVQNTSTPQRNWTKESTNFSLIWHDVHNILYLFISFTLSISFLVFV